MIFRVTKGDLEYRFSLTCTQILCLLCYLTGSSLGETMKQYAPIADKPGCDSELRVEDIVSSQCLYNGASRHFPSPYRGNDVGIFTPGWWILPFLLTGLMIWAFILRKLIIFLW